MWEKWQIGVVVTFIFGWSKCSPSVFSGARYNLETLNLNYLTIGLTQIVYVGLFPPHWCHPSRQRLLPVTVGARRIERCLDVMTRCLNLDYPRACDISASAPPRVPSSSCLWPSGGYCRTGAPMDAAVTSCHLELAAQQGTPLSRVFTLLHVKVSRQKRCCFEIKLKHEFTEALYFFLNIFVHIWSHFRPLILKRSDKKIMLSQWNPLHIVKQSWRHCCSAELRLSHMCGLQWLLQKSKSVGREGKMLKCCAAK